MKVVKSVKFDDGQVKQIEKIAKEKGSDFSKIVRDYLDIAIEGDGIPKSDVIEILLKLQAKLDREELKNERIVKLIKKDINKLWEMIE